MPDPGPSISLVYPMYNERENIARALEHGVQALSSTTSLWEIIVVDDGSTDGGSEIVARFTRDYPNVRLISHDSNRGLGESLRSGFAQTRHEAVLYTDVDLPCDLSILRDVLPMLRKVDLVKGYRLNGRGSFLRAVYSWAYNLLVRNLFGLSVRDVNFAFKLFRRDFLDRIQLESRGAFIDAELLIKMTGIGGRMLEVGMIYQPRRYGTSKLCHGKVILSLLRELWSQWRKFRNGKKILS